MAGTTPAALGLVEVATQLSYYLGLSAAAGIGVTVVALSVGRASSVLSRRLDRLVVPVAAFVTLSAVLHVVTAASSTAGLDTASGVQAGAYLMVVAAMAWVRVHASLIAGWWLALCTVATATIPVLPLRTLTTTAVVTKVLVITHLCAALVWAGGLIVLALLGVVGRSHRSGDSTAEPAMVAEEWRRVWERFSVIAVYAVGALIISGSWLAWTHVGTPIQLVTTAYGRALAVKLAIVMLLLIAGAYNVRVLLPRIRSARHAGDTGTVLRLATRHFPMVVAGEAVLITAVLGIVPFLRGSARTEAGGPGAGSIDLGVFGVGLILVGFVALGLWAGTRVATSRRA